MPYPRPAGRVPRPLAELLPLLGGVRPTGDVSGLQVTGVSHDSRAIRPGDLYAGLPGATVHGAEFATAARDAGAVAMLSDRDAGDVLPTLVVDAPRAVLGTAAAWIYGDPSAELDVIGVTGTNGKTTTAFLLDAGFAATGRPTGMIGTVETRIAGEVLASEHTTPEASDLQALLAVMRERGVRGVSMEVSSIGLAEHRVDGTSYAAAIFTNFSQDHLDYHGDMERYFKAKAALFEPGRAAVAVVNVDDDAGLRLLDRIRLPLVTTSVEGTRPADWRATELAAGRDGTTFRLRAPGIDRTIRLKLVGDYNVANTIGALAALVSVGVDADTAIAGVEGLAGVPGRLERVEAGQPWLALVDYAHTPDSVAHVLRTVRPLADGGRVIVVFGCGGDRDRGKRPLMGEAAARHADVVVVTSDNPRSEDPDAIVAAILPGVAAVPGATALVEPDRARAIALACAEAKPGDVVVVSGKGHEQGQVFADRTVPFDDRAVLRGAIEEALG